MSGTFDVRIGFPKGFTVRDLDTLYDVLKETIACFDPNWFSWNGDGMDWCDISIEEIRAFVSAVESREWDVAPDVSQFREILEEEGSE